MPYCPNCFTEYQIGITQCVDCNIALVDGTPSVCPKCEEPVSKDETFCDHCGVLLLVADDAKIPDCDTHPDEEAIGGCIVCGKPVCEDCANMVEGKVFCDNDSHYNIHQDFAIAYTTSTDYEAVMIQANLEGAGISAQIFNQHDHVYFTTMGSLALVNVMVPKHQVEKAREIIQTIFEQSETDADSKEDMESPA